MEPGGPPWAGVLRKQRPPGLPGPSPHAPSLSASSGQALPALPPRPRPVVLPAACTVDMAGFSEPPAPGEEARGGGWVEHPYAPAEDRQHPTA